MHVRRSNVGILCKRIVYKNDLTRGQIDSNQGAIRRTGQPRSWGSDLHHMPLPQGFLPSADTASVSRTETTPIYASGSDRKMRSNWSLSSQKPLALKHTQRYTNSEGHSYWLVHFLQPEPESVSLDILMAPCSFQQILRRARRKCGRR